MSKPRLKTLSHKLQVSELPKQSARPEPKQVVTRKLAGRTRTTKRDALWAAAGGKCQSCDRAVFGKGEVHLDHIVPLSQGGTDDDDNLQILCVPCHEDKTKEENIADGKRWSGRFF